jgi:hypothetical protein
MHTHSWFTRKLVLGSGLLLAGLILDCLATPASAALGARTKREPQRVSNFQLYEGLHVLQGTKLMLERADHDYGGHRVAAIKAIDAAEQQLRLALRSQHKRTPLGGKTGGKARGRQPEPQGISNLQLADAIVILERTRTLLQKADHDYGGHRVAAVRDIGAAIHQLQVALKFERKVR